MTDWHKKKSIFPITYSKKGRRPPQLLLKPANWKIVSDSDDDAIFSAVYKDRGGNTHSSSDPSPMAHDDSSVPSDKSSSPYSENSQFLSFTKSHSNATVNSSQSNTSADENKSETLKRNPKVPFRARQQVKYSIILEESSESGTATAPKKMPIHGSRTVYKKQPFGKRSAFRRKMQTTTKLMKDSLRADSDSAEDCSSDLNFLTIDSTGEEDSELTTATESSFPQDDIGATDSVHSHRFGLNMEEILQDYDIEIMRDAPPAAKLEGKGREDDKCMSSESLKISPVKLHHLPTFASKSNIYHKKRIPTKGRKNSTLIQENLSAKHIQDVSFFKDISDISGSSLTSSAGGTSDEDLFSTLKASASTDTTLKPVQPVRVQRVISHLSPASKQVSQTEYIKTPKKHNIKRTAEKKLPPLTQLDGDHLRQVSFNKVNEETIYEPGSRMKLPSPPVVSRSLPKLSPSVSILKKAVSTWHLDPTEGGDTEQQKAATSTPIYKRRRSRNRPNIMDFSFELSSVPIPSYNDNDLIVPACRASPSEKQTIDRREAQQSPGYHVKHSTPSPQVKRESPDAGIPCRPLKRRCCRQLPSSSVSTDADHQVKKQISDHANGRTKQKKRLEYQSVAAVGPGECTVTKLCDGIFYNISATKKSDGLHVNSSFVKDIPLDILTTIPDSLFQ